MGNCIKKESPTQWAGEDWSSPVPESVSTAEAAVTSQEKGGSTEVKIKISKKQLEELLGRTDGLTVQQVLSQLIKVSDGFQRPWRPALQSIPEID